MEVSIELLMSYVRTPNRRGVTILEEKEKTTFASSRDVMAGR